MFASRHDAVGAAEVNADEAWFDACDGTDDDGADFVFEGRENGVTFGFAEALDNDLFGSLGGDATERFDGEVFFDGVADFGVFVCDLVERDFGGWVVGYALLDDFAGYVDVGFAGLGIEGGADVHITVAVVFAPGGGDGLLDDVEDSLFREAFFFRNDINHGGHLLEI